MIDSGSQSSLVSEGFVLKHQLTCAPLRPAILIQGLDGEPLSKGSISHVVVLNVKLGDHSEFKTFGIVKMPWDLLLGIDWLQKHNPVINWKSGSITFSCCNSGRLGSPAHVPSLLDSHSLCNFGHLGAHHTTQVPGSPILPSIDIAMLSACDFFWLNNILHMGLLSLTPTPSSVCTTAVNTPSPSPSITAKVPSKYHEYLSLFVEKEVTELPPHHTHDIKIELEQGKSH